MANIFSHHEADLATGILAASNDMANNMWGNNALQTVTIARNFPRDPQQAIGYRGIVDYTSAVQTTDFTLDCILTEQSDAAVNGATSGTSVYRFADDEVILGTEHYVLTSCNLTFTAGSPATVSYGYITAGAGSSLAELATPPDVLIDGEEAAFAVVMGDDGSGIVLTDGAGVAGTILPSGVQSLNFSSTINKDNILDVRAAQPIQFITTYPIDVTADIETYDPTGAGALSGLGVRLAQGTAHANRSTYTLPSRTPGSNFASLDKILCTCNGLIKVSENESLNVGGYVTYSFNYTASDLAIPLSHS
jgi:hypothetical protein